MQIWVDADACPNVIKDIISRAAQRAQIVAYFIANQLIRLPASPYLRAIQVEKGFDIADNYIAEHIQAADLAITADIPLAASVVAKGARAINPRGELYSEKNIREILNMRDLMATLRDSGVETGGPSPFNHADRQAFANQLDRLITQHQSTHPLK
jgi:uncharacterized protein YaiI (UPF0178 family)